MRIGIDIRTLMEKEYSGVSEYTFNLVRAILREDRENEYKLFYNSGRDIKDRLPVFNYENVEVVGRRYPNKIFNCLSQKILRYPKIDRMLGTDVFWMPHINFISLSPETKKILTIHDLSFLRYPDFFSLRRNLWHYIINVKKLMRESDKIIAVSENTKNDIVELGGIDENKVEVVYSGLGEEYGIIEKNDENLKRVKEKHGLADKFILFLGTLEPRKNIIGLIKAYNKLREGGSGFDGVGLAIAGGEGWKGKGILDEWSKSKYRNDIKFLGYIPGEDKVYLYNLASVFVFPSFYEGFGFPPLEAMACGLPVISSFSSSLPEIGGEAFFPVDPYQTGEMAKAIERVLTDENLRNNLAQSGRKKALEFSWRKAAEKYLDIFKEL
ncbi:MAG: glycosyltransferase family 1 protein [Patescibacteria group bacterium]|nr:glycosyltransferase family 1 protein [Patescibacteria group bacterium]